MTASDRNTMTADELNKATKLTPQQHQALRIDVWYFFNARDENGHRIKRTRAEVFEAMNKKYEITYYEIEILLSSLVVAPRLVREGDRYMLDDHSLV